MIPPINADASPGNIVNCLTREVADPASPVACLPTHTSFNRYLYDYQYKAGTVHNKVLRMCCWYVYLRSSNAAVTSGNLILFDCLKVD